jgi:hypothetical protein
MLFPFAPDKYCSAGPKGLISPAYLPEPRGQLALSSLHIEARVNSRSNLSARLFSQSVSSVHETPAALYQATALEAAKKCFDGALG